MKQMDYLKKDLNNDQEFTKMFSRIRKTEESNDILDDQNYHF